MYSVFSPRGINGSFKLPILLRRVHYTQGPATDTRQTEKKQPPAKGVLVGYPMFSKKRDGIMVNAETLAGG